MEKRARSHRWRLLGLAILLFTGGFTSTALAVLGKQTTSTPARSVSSVPGLARALGITTPTHVSHKSRPKSRHQPRPTSHPQPVVSQVLKATTGGSLPEGALLLVAGETVTRRLVVTNTGNVAIRTLTISPSTNLFLHHLAVAIFLGDNRLIDSRVPFASPLIVNVDLAPKHSLVFEVVISLGSAATQQGVKGVIRWHIVAQSV